MRRRDFFTLGLLSIVASLAILAPAARADDKPSPDGEWLFTLDFPEMGFGEFKLECLLKMKAEGEKVTGQIGGSNGDGIVPILDGTFKDQEIAFRVVDPQGIVSRYKGKLDGERIKGKFEVEIPGADLITLDWDAKRQPAKK